MLDNKELILEVQAETRKKSADAIDVHAVARRVIVWSAILATAAFSAIGIYPTACAFMTNERWIDEILQRHFAATVGMPAIAALAFLIVITFEARFDTIEMDFFRIVKFKGAAGPIILWAFCVLTMASCIRMLW